MDQKTAELKTLFNERFGIDCGIDEAGRGSWAGPVVAAAVVLPKNFYLESLDDSKKLSKKNREIIFNQLKGTSKIGVGYASSNEIDQYNILQATFLAMKRAINALADLPDRALIDGNVIPPKFPCPAEAIVKGDSRVASIAAASVIAKVTRDRLMKNLAKTYPGYGWETNFGYGVKAHSDALKTIGLTPEHRRSFKPIHNILC